MADIVISLKSAVTVGLSIYLITAKVLIILVAILVILVMVSALILIIVTVIYKESNIYFLAGVFLLLYNN